MKLYLLEQCYNLGYDTYDSAVVAADSELEAAKTHPSVAYEGEDRSGVDDCTWCNIPTQVVVTLLGEAKEGTEAGIICASFNAG